MKNKRTCVLYVNRKHKLLLLSEKWSRLLIAYWRISRLATLLFKEHRVCRAYQIIDIWSWLICTIETSLILWNVNHFASIYINHNTILSFCCIATLQQFTYSFHILPRLNNTSLLVSFGVGTPDTILVYTYLPCIYPLKITYTSNIPPRSIFLKPVNITACSLGNYSPWYLLLYNMWYHSW